MMDGNAEICCAGGALGMDAKSLPLLSFNGDCDGSSLLMARLVDDTMQRRGWFPLAIVPHCDSNFAADRNNILLQITLSIDLVDYKLLSRRLLHQKDDQQELLPRYGSTLVIMILPAPCILLVLCSAVCDWGRKRRGGGG